MLLDLVLRFLSPRLAPALGFSLKNEVFILFIF